MIIFIGMINKLIGFETMWRLRKTLWVNFLIMIIGFIVIGWVLKGVEQLEEKETKYD